MNAVAWKVIYEDTAKKGFGKKIGSLLLYFVLSFLIFAVFYALAALIFNLSRMGGTTQIIFIVWLGIGGILALAYFALLCWNLNTPTITVCEEGVVLERDFSPGGVFQELQGIKGRFTEKKAIPWNEIKGVQTEVREDPKTRFKGYNIYFKTKDGTFIRATPDAKTPEIAETAFAEFQEHGAISASTPEVKEVLEKKSTKNWLWFLLMMIASAAASLYDKRGWDSALLASVVVGGIAAAYLWFKRNQDRKKVLIYE